MLTYRSRWHFTKREQTEASGFWNDNNERSKSDGTTREGESDDNYATDNMWYLDLAQF